WRALARVIHQHPWALFAPAKVRQERGNDFTAAGAREWPRRMNITRISPLPLFRSLLPFAVFRLLLLNAPYLSNLRAEPVQFLPEQGVPLQYGLVLVKPADGPVIPLAGLVLLGHLPIGHGQEECIDGVLAAEGGRFGEGFGSRRPITGAVLGDAQD